MDNAAVKNSKIQGKGVFVNRDFEIGEEIIKIDDSHTVNSEDELTDFQKQYEADWLFDIIVIMQAPEKHINHSCDPNTYIKTINGVRRVIAMRPIVKGEEITYDYAVNGYYDSAMKCNCGSTNCRRILNCNFFKLPKQIQMKYMPYLDQWFIERFEKELEEIRNP